MTAKRHARESSGQEVRHGQYKIQQNVILVSALKFNIADMLKEVLILAFTLVATECTKPPAELPAEPPAEPPRFIGSYQYLPGVGYYKLYKYKLTWGDAWSQCRDDNAHLLVVNSQQELEAVKALMIEAKSDGWSHIGVHDLFLNGRYITVRGKLPFHIISLSRPIQCV